MDTLISQATTRKPADKTAFTLSGLLATLLMVNLREKLDAQTAGDKSDAAYTWGL